VSSLIFNTTLVKAIVDDNHVGDSYFLWFIILCVKGLKYLNQQQAHPNAVT